MTTQYNILDLPQRHTVGNGNVVVDYRYAADGRKLQEKVTQSSSQTSRDYVGEFIYENGTLKKILFDGGYVDMIGDSPVYMFFIKDHLGSVRAVVSETGEVQHTNEFYPYGDLFSTAGTASSNGNRYSFTGKELGDETGFYDFSARFLQTSLGRFTTIDPLAEKYPSVSPYAYCNGNPVNFVDIDGRFPFATNLIGGLASVAVEYVSQVVDNCISNRNFDVSNFTNVDIANLGVAFVEGFVTSGTNIVKKATVKTIVGVSGSILSNTVDIKIAILR